MLINLWGQKVQLAKKKSLVLQKTKILSFIFLATLIICQLKIVYLL